MFGLGTTEMLIILALVLIVFGAGKAPEIGTLLGKSLHGLRKVVKTRDAINVTPGEDENNDKTP